MSPDSSSDDRDPVERLAEEFVARLRRGQHPSPAEYAERYPQWAGRIHELFPALLLMEQHRPGVSDSSGSPQDGGAGAATAPPERLGDYRILREIGRGGMAVVYEAEQVSLGRHVALKVLPRQVLPDPKQRQRFEREARSAGRLHHTNIVPVFGVGEEGGLHYYVMQYIQGQGLDEVLSELRRLKHEMQPSGRGPLPGKLKGSTSAMSVEAVARTMLTLGDGPPNCVPDPGLDEVEGRGASLSSRRDDGGSPSAAGSPSGSSLALPGPGGEGRRSKAESYWYSVARVGLQVAGALHYAHQQGVLHRDIKPSNLLLDVQGSVWITDFGLAKAADEADLTGTGDIIGTLRYMAPERFRGTSDPRGDVYGLGMTLYELLTLCPAFVGTDRARLIHRITQTEPTRPSRLDPEVPRDLETICLKAIDREPSHRYQTAGELAEDLRRFLEDRPIQARRASPGERVGRWCRRNPALAGVTALAAALLIAVAAVSSIGYIRTSAALARERQARASAQRRFALARKAIESYYTGASEDVLLKQPQLASLRTKLLNMSLAFYQELQAELERESRDDPATRAELAAAYTRVGELTEQVGTRAAALEALERARAIREALMTADPSTDGPQRDLAGVLETIGTLQSRTSDREAEALPTLERALSLRETIANARPDSPDDRAAVAGTLRRIGNSLFPLGRPAQALRHLERARVILERLEAEYPDRESLRSEAAHILKQLSYTERVSGRIDDSLRDLGRARQILERLAVEHPANAEYRARLAEVFSDLGSDLTTAGRLPEALDAEGRALAIHEELTADSPTNTDYQYMVASHRKAMGWILGTLGRRDEAMRSLSLARADLGRLVADYPGNVLFRRELAQCVAFLGTTEQDLGRYDQAFKTLELARELYERLPAEPISLYNLACIDSRLSLFAGSDLTGEAVRARGDTYADKAIEALRRAVAAGYREVEFLRKDPDLAPLRSRDDFQRILLDAAFPDDPFAR